MASQYEIVIVGGEQDGAAVSISGRVTIGSAKGTSIQLRDPSVKPQHAQLAEAADGTLWVGALSSEGPVLVDGEPIAEAAAVNDGARISVGPVTFTVRRRTPTQPAVKTTVEPSLQAQAIIPLTEQAPPVASSPSSPTLSVPQVPWDRPSDGQEQDLPTHQAILPGHVIDGRYKVLHKLATGGMGEVYKAQHVGLGRVFAVKVMKPELSADPEFVDRFKREAIAASRIGQHNIVDISDFGRTDDGRFYFVMELLEGGTLSQLIKATKAIEPERALFICLQMARALGAAHALGIVHRDLKPENVVLLQRDGHPDFVKVLDFGVAKVNHADEQVKPGDTAVGMVVGTPQYMSPEQASALPVDARSDIYSLGLIVYELIAGRPTFEGATPSIIMAAHMREPAPPLTSGLQLPLDVELVQLVAQMLEKRPEARPQSMGEVIQTFERVLGLPSRATPQRGLHHPPGLRPGLSTPATASTTPAGPVLTPSPVEAIVIPSPKAPEPFGDELASVRPSKAPLVLGVGLMAVAVVALVASFSSFQEGQHASAPPAAVARAAPLDPPTPPPLPPALVPKVKVAITSTPPNLEVLADGAVIGKTPLDLDWDKGKVLKLTVQGDGLVPETRTVAPQEDFGLAFALKPTPKRAAPVRPAEAPVEPPKPEDDLKDAPY